MLKVVRVSIDADGKVLGFQNELVQPLNDEIQLSEGEIEFLDGLASLQESEVEACLQVLREAV